MQRRSITDVGEGVLEGVGVLGSSFLRGFKGLVEKPLQGAQQKGVGGERGRGGRGEELQGEQQKGVGGEWRSGCRGTTAQVFVGV